MRRPKFRGCKKTISERKFLPVFDGSIEIHAWDRVRVYSDTAACIDGLLSWHPVIPELRPIDTPLPDSDSTPIVEASHARPAHIMLPPMRPSVLEMDSVSICAFALNIDRIYEAIHTLKVPACVSQSLSQADMILTTKSQMRSGGTLTQLLQGRQIPVHLIHRNSASAIQSFLRDYFNVTQVEGDEEVEAEREIITLCRRVKDERAVMDALPRMGSVRRSQHNIVDELGLNSWSIGEEPHRRVRVYPR